MTQARLTPSLRQISRYGEQSSRGLHSPNLSVAVCGNDVLHSLRFSNINRGSIFCQTRRLNQPIGKPCCIAFSLSGPAIESPIHAARRKWLFGLRRMGAQPFGDVPGPKAHAGGDLIVRDDVAGRVAVDGLGANPE